MAKYCANCGAEIGDGGNYCPECGAAVGGYVNARSSSGVSDAVKTAAMVGGTVLGATALNNLAWQMTHRRRPPYCGFRRSAPPPPGPGSGGFGRRGGPGGRR